MTRTFLIPLLTIFCVGTLAACGEK